MSKHIKVGILGAVLLIMISVSGCSDAGSVIDNWAGELQERIEQNQAQVDRIRQAGLLSEERAAALKEAIAKQENRLKEMSAEDAKKYAVRADGLARTAGGITGKGESAEGVEIISTDDDAVRELLENLDYSIYVLRKDPLGTGKEENSLATLDMISSEVEKAKRGESSNIDSYFVDSGRKVFDLSDPANKLITETKPNGITDIFNECEAAQTDNHNIIGYHFLGVKTKTHSLGGSQHMDQESAIELKLKEFNPKAVDRLVGAEGVNKDVYVMAGSKCYLMEYPVCTVTGFRQEGNTYKALYGDSDMRINLLTKKIMDKDGRECVTTAGDILKVSGTGGYSELGEASFVVDGVCGEQTEFGYDPRGESGQNGTPANGEKFGRVILRDYLELNYMPSVLEGENLLALGRRIRLIKFKGAGNESVALFVDKGGKEIQNSLRITVNDLMDISAGEDGKRKKLNMESSANDETGREETNDTVTDPESTGDSEGASDVTESDRDVSSVYTVGQSQERILETEYVTEINTSVRFPGPLIAKSDTLELGQVSSSGSGEGSSGEGAGVTPETSESEDTTGGTGGSGESDDDSGKTNEAEGKIKHFMYGIAIDIDPFRSNLFSGWVDIVGDNGDVGSLDWWNHWLTESTYRYFVDRDKVMNFLAGNYIYEMRENGNILLDLDTITKIQKQYNQEDKADDAAWINTMFIILGMCLTAYSLLLPAAWVYDTNVAVGPKLMKLLTCGRWEAMRGTEELPELNTEKKHYMTFAGTVQGCVILVAFGTLLSFVDILSIVDILVKVLGNVAEVFANVLQGIV